MSEDLISRSALLKEVRENKELFESERVYLEGLLLNAPTVDTYTIEDIQTVREDALILGAKLAQRPQGECKACDYYKLAQSFINGIVEVISKNGLTSIDELLEILKREANKNE